MTQIKITCMWCWLINGALLRFCTVLTQRPIIPFPSKSYFFKTYIKLYMSASFASMHRVLAFQHQAALS